ncbi:hypothetical protein DPMN_154663 [Dreissena polymorpha]|uniref:Uncharacterized protein n=1 Tax=Dreissena polymorpha TaxID=45954 RepID=A0A9D4J9B4_DREPO|nr:hypothetical protein DPMN_154663 [Dreissena polymorpha]
MGIAHPYGGQEKCPLFHIIHPAFFNGFYGDLPLVCPGAQSCKRVMPGDVSKPRQLSSFDRQEWLLWRKKCCYHVPDILVCLVIPVVDEDQSPESLKFKDLFHAFCVRVNLP